MLIGENYKIESDDLTVTLYLKHVNRETDRERWEAIGWFSSFKKALKSLADREVSLSALTDLEMVVRRQDEIYELINSLNIHLKP